MQVSVCRACLSSLKTCKEKTEISNITCPRCGKEISSEFRFCPNCKFPIRERDQLSEQLSTYPVPFELTKEQRKTYSAPSDEIKESDITEESSRGGAGRFVILCFILAAVLLAAFIITKQNGKNKKNAEIPG